MLIPYDHGCLIIHTSHSHHHDQVTRALIEAKANIEATEEDGWTAIMFAAQNGHEPVRKLHLLISLDKTCLIYSHTLIHTILIRSPGH